MSTSRAVVPPTPDALLSSPRSSLLQPSPLGAFTHSPLTAAVDGVSPLPRGSPAPALRPGWLPNQLAPLTAGPPNSTAPLLATLETVDRGAYESMGLFRVRCKCPLSTFVFFCNQGFSRRLMATGGGETWAKIDPAAKCICVGEAVDGAAVVSISLLQRLMLNSSVVSCGNRGRGAGSTAGMASDNEGDAVAIAGFDAVISRHLSIRLPTSGAFVTVDVQDFISRWLHGQEPCDMAELAQQ
jgi:hypothetical protein